MVGVVALAIGGPWIAHQLRTLPRDALAARADQRIVTLEVGGMTCAGCAAKVEERLTGLPGVAAAVVRYRERRAYVVVADGVADTMLTGAISRAGPGFLGAVVAK